MVDKMIEQILQDNVGKNVRATLTKCLSTLRNDKEPYNLRVSKCIYDIEKILEESNIPSHLRISLMNLLTELEKLK